MPAKPKRYKNETQIARWLREEGYCRTELAKTFGIGYNLLEKHLARPAEYLSINQMWVIAGLVQRPFLEILYAVIKHPNLQRDIGESFEDMTGLEVDVIKEGQERGEIRTPQQTLKQNTEGNFGKRTLTQIGIAFNHFKRFSPILSFLVC